MAERAAAEPIDVLVVGSANLDLVAGAPRIPAPGETVLGTSFAEHAGGKGLNQAVAAARAGARVAMVAAVGQDAAGAALRRVMTDDGIDDALVVVTDDLPTGRALITVDASGENSIVVVAGANAAVTCPRDLPPARVVLAQLEVPVDVVLEAFTAARAAGATTLLNPAPARDLPAELLAVTDVIVPNEHEVGLLGGVPALRAAGVSTVIVTRGGQGVDVTTADGTRHRDSFPVRPVDTTGAGDAFCGALAASLASGAALDDAVTFAAAAGALATTVAGAVPSLPRRADVEHLLATS